MAFVTGLLSFVRVFKRNGARREKMTYFVSPFADSEKSSKYLFDASF